MLRLVRSFRPFSTTKTINWSQPTTHRNYYEVLGVPSGATAEQIKEAYRKLVEVYHPGLNSKGDPKKFQIVSEAYVILSNDQTKRAYDLLQKGGKHKTHITVEDLHTRTHQLSQQEVEKEQKRKENQKRLNLDDFGRYRGGLPKYKGWNKRGGAFGKPGVFHDKIEEESEEVSDYQTVDAEKAESFKKFHQDEREYRTTKWTWIKAEVDYDYFSMKRFGRPFAWVRNAIILLWIVPYFIGEYVKATVAAKTNALREKHGLEPLSS